MVPLGDLLKKAGKLASDNSPAILTAVGVTGTLATAYLTGKASVIAHEIVMEERNAQMLPPTSWINPRWVFKQTWKLYIPAAGTAAITISAIIFANRIGMRRAAALAAAYSVSEKAFETYREKIIEKIGDKKEQAVRDEIAQERVDRDPVDNKQVIITSGGSVLCFEAYTGRYFLCDMETLRKAQNDINHQVLNDGYASLSDWYDLVGLPETANSNEVGWTSDKLLELQFSAVLSESGKPCISVGFSMAPVRHYNRLS